MTNSSRPPSTCMQCAGHMTLMETKELPETAEEGGVKTTQDN